MPPPSRHLPATRVVLWSGAALVLVVATACGGSETADPIVTRPAATGLVGTGVSASDVPGTDVPGPDVPASSTPTTSSTGGSALRVTTVGFGDVTFGTPFDQARAELGTELVAGDQSDPGCYVATAGSLPGLVVVVADGRVEAVGAVEPVLETPSGIGVGSTVDEVAAAYPDRLQTQPRPDGQPGDALVFVPQDAADADYRIVFLTDGSAVTAVRAGRVPMVFAAPKCA